jgi:hypothetical protein
MSIELLLQDIKNLDAAGVEKRLADWWSGMPEWLQSFVTKAKSAQGVILTGLVETAAVDVAAGGFTTASFVSAGKDVLAKAEAQELGFSQQEVMSALNLAANALKPATAPTPDTSAAPGAPPADSPPSA